MKKTSPFAQLNFSEIHKKELDLLKELAHFKLSQDASALKTPGGHSKLRRLVREAARFRAQAPRVFEAKTAVSSEAAPKVAKKSAVKSTAKSAEGAV